MRVHIFTTDEPDKLKTLKDAFKYLEFYHDRFWYEDESQDQYITECLYNLNKLIKEEENAKGAAEKTSEGR